MANVITSAVVTCLILSYNMHSFELLAEILLCFSMVQMFMYMKV
jgi:hypothetical protein